MTEQLLARGSVLVVDDDGSSRREAAAMLASSGYDVAVAHDAEGGFDLLDARPFDLIISDLHLPGVDGLQFLETIRAAGMDTDFLMISGKGSIGIAVLSMKIGAANFIEKPLTSEKLMGEVRRIFRARKEGSDPGSGSNPRPGARPTQPPSLWDVRQELDSSPGIPCLAIGRYEIRGTLGAGGMATIYEAWDPMLSRPVALKVWFPHQAKDFGDREVFMERFRREAQAAAMLKHSNIVAVHDFGEDVQRDALFLAMELIEGPTLLELIVAEGPLPPGRSVNIARQIADALAEAHRNGIIHRDVKPSNVIVQDGDALKVLDFGVAHLANSELTEAGVVCGSVAYVAPEILRGKPLDHRADQFALGVVMFEMLTGQRLFTGDDFASIAHSVLETDPPTLWERGGHGPPELQSLLNRMMSKSPADRFEDEDELLAKFDAIASSLTLRNSN